ncbi:MAG TPA: metal-sensitive transcriptional regulator [Anaeromyxobacteraceae bacterium]|nr:metal-sensitive transcriptional regulator [Anaeromyxobacteraceae bacterium]
MSRPSDPAAASACGCGAATHVGPGGSALAVDAATKDANLKRLRRIEGQVRGLQKMVEDGRYCADILTQVASVHEALRAVGRELMRNHLKHCASGAIREGGARADEMYDELIDLMYRQVR